MSNKIDKFLLKNESYGNLLSELKNKIRSTQVRAALSVNAQLIAMYWELGRIIVQQQEQHKWGSAFIDQLSHDLSVEFPEMKGFSRSNLYYVKKWYVFYNEDGQNIPQPAGQMHDFTINPIVQQLVGQIPWGHNITIIEAVKSHDQAIWYIQQTIENGWSRNILSMQIKSKLYERQGKKGKDKVTNFTNSLPKNHSDLAENIMKDPYVFDFLSLGKEAHEREVEHELATHIRELEYQLTEKIPKELKTALPTVEEIEEELNRSLG